MGITCSSILGNCFSVIPLVKDDFLYFWCYEENIEKLKSQIEELKAKHATVERSVQRGCITRSEETTEEVKHWFSTVNKALGDSCKIEEKVGQERENRLRGRCPNWWARYQLGKEVAQLAESVKEIIRKENFTRVTDVPPTPFVESVLDDSVAFASADSILDQIMQSLRNNEKKNIGVHGMGGVGKTTLMKRLNNKLGKINLFDRVIMVSISQDPDVRIIQDEIAKRIPFKFADHENPYIRARKLSEKLKEVKKLLIILDDVWSRFELNDVGIPSRSEHEGCRIILTTRNEDICRQMGTQWNIELKVLPKAESWALLKTKAGDVVDSDEIKPIAENILKSCQGLPLAIVTIGSTLKDEGDERMWNHALRQLTNESAIKLEGVMPGVIKSIRYSYDRLESDEIKRFFLLCCLFPEDWQIDPSILIALGFGEGFFRGCWNYRDAREDIHVIIKKLKASSLLLEGNYGEVVMHDIVRDVAIYIASNEHDFFVRSGPKLDKWPEIEELGKCSRISLTNNEITTLPNNPQCPNLLSLILEGNKDLRKMPDLFFENMRGLVVLDLGRTGIKQLPSSISYLKCLRALLLCRCVELEEISAIEGLEKLESLDLEGTAIRDLPKGIKRLTNLKSLDLSNTYSLNVSSNLISSLSGLEELYMSGSFDGWETGNLGDGSKAHLSEVASLPRLAVLEIGVENSDLLNLDDLASLEKLTRFTICGGSDMLSSFGRLSSPKLIIEISCVDILRISDWVKVLLQKTEELILEYVNGLENILQLGASGMNSLIVLSIDENREMKYLFDVKKELTHFAFPRLTKVSLFSMESLISISKGPVPVGSLNSLEELTIIYSDSVTCLFSTTLLQALQNLKSLQIENCNGMEKIISDEEETVVAGDGVLPQELPKPFALSNLKHLIIRDCKNLKYLFPYRLAQNLIHLDTIEVVNCYKMEEIIFIDKDEAPVHENILPMLKDIHLSVLPELTTICKGRPIFHCPSLEKFFVRLCPELKRLPMGSQSAPRLRSFYAEKEWLEGLEWEDETIKSHLSSLVDENVSSIPSVEYFLTER